MFILFKYLRQVCGALFGACYFMAIMCLTFLPAIAEFYNYFFVIGSFFLVLLFVIVFFVPRKEEGQEVGKLMEQYNNEHEAHNSGK